MKSASDGELDAMMARLGDGDRSVFEPVFTRLWGPTLRLCNSILKHEADAADAAQQAMQRILERASDYDRTRPALPWALGIAAWQCRALQRRQWRRREVPHAVSNSDSQPGSDAEGEQLERELAQLALAALGELSELDRETLIATFWDQPASASGPTLRKRRERAIERLRSTFRRLYGLGQ